MVFLVLLPLVMGLGMALSSEGRAAMGFWWRDGRGWIILARTLLFAASGATVATLSGFAMAMLLPRSRAAARAAVLLACLPLLVPSSLVGVAWIMAMGRDALVTNALRPLMGDATPTVYMWPVAAAVTGLRYVGVAVLIAVATAGMPVSSRAAERVFELGARQRLRLRASRLAAPLAAAWIILLLLIQADHILPGMFLVHTFGTEVLIQFNALMDPAGAGAIALVPTVMALGLAMVCAMLMTRRGEWTSSVVRGEDGGALSRHPAAVWGGCALLLVILFVVVGVPVMGLVARVSGVDDLLNAWRESRPELWRSLWLASAGAVICAIVAIPLAAGWVTALRERAATATPVVLLNLAAAGSLIALGLIALPWPSGLRDSDMPLLCGYAARFAPVATVVMMIGWMRLPEADDLAARVHGVPWFRRVLRVTLPVRAPAVIGATLLCALLSAAELEMSLMLVPPGPTTLGVRLYTLIHTAPDHVVSSVAILVLLMVIGIGAMAMIAMHLHERRRRAWAG